MDKRYLITLTAVLWLFQPTGTSVAIGAGDHTRQFTALAQMYHNTAPNECIHLKFLYHTASELSGEGDVIQGQIWYRGQQFHLEADGNIFIMDSLTFYQVYPEQHQLLIENAVAMGDELHPAGLLGQLDKHFRSLDSRMLPDGTQLFYLEPLNSDWLTEVRLHAVGERVLDLELLDINNTSTVIQLTAEERLVGADIDSLFQLPEWLEDFEIIDLRGTHR